MASMQRHELNIPRQSLDAALKELAQQTGIQIARFSDAIDGGAMVGPVSGSLSAQEALRSILTPRGLTYKIVDERTLAVVKPDETQASGESTAAGLPAGSPVRLAQNAARQDSAPGAGASSDELTGSDATPESLMLEEVTVFGRGSRASVRDVPQTVNVFTGEMLEIIPGTTVQDVMRFIPSASNLIGDYSFTHNFNIRGFRTAATWNGMLPGIAAPGKIESANVERIEVLMGPAAVLYGAMEPGAVINVVTKQPTKSFRSQLNVQGGSFDTYGADIDVGGPITEGVAARLNASYMDSGAPFDAWALKSLFIAPVITFDVGERTRLTIEGAYRRSSYPEGIFDGRVPVAGTLQPNPNGDIPLGFNSGYVPGISESKDVWTSGNVRLRHDFSDTFELNAQLTYAKDDLTGPQSFGGALAPDERTLGRLIVKGDQGQENYLAAINLTNRFSLGSVQHRLTTGLDYLDYDAATVYEIYTGAVPALDVFEPDYAVPGPTSYFPFFFYKNSQRVAAAFIQDQVKLGERWTLLAGLRYTDSKSESALNPPGQPIIDLPDAKAKKWSSQYGVLYQLSNAVMIYANHTTSFQPRDTIVGRDGSIYSTPETAAQYELGTRFDLGASGLTANLALFHIDKPNVRTTDPVDAFYQIDAGEVRSRGVELSVNGTLKAGWTVYGAYAYNQTEVTKSNIPGAEGKHFANAPEHTLALLTRYDFQAGALKGLGLSAAVNYLGDKYADAANALQLPSSTRLDMAAYYRFSDRVEVSLHGNNITDEDIYNGFSPLMIMRNAGRTYMANVKIDF